VTPWTRFVLFVTEVGARRFRDPSNGARCCLRQCAGVQGGGGRGIALTTFNAYSDDADDVHKTHPALGYGAFRDKRLCNTGQCNQGRPGRRRRRGGRGLIGGGVRPGLARPVNTGAVTRDDNVAGDR